MGKPHQTHTQGKTQNKSGVSATSGVMLTQSGYNSNQRYYQDQAMSQNTTSGNQLEKLNASAVSNTFDRLNTLGSQNNLMNNTVIGNQTASLRPITRDVKLRSQADRVNTGPRTLHNNSKTKSQANNYT